MYEWINPVSGIVTSGFGYRTNPVLNKEELHDGMDIAVDEGTEVLAVQNGIITQKYYSSTFGNVLVYKTDNGYEIKYAHLQGAAVEENERIEKGQVIAYSGNTGLSTGAHLHYTIIKDGNYLNPANFYKQQPQN